MVYALKLLFPALVVCLIAAMMLRKAFEPLLSRTEYDRAWMVLLATTVLSFLAGTPLFFIFGIIALAFLAPAYLGGGVRGRIAVYMLLVLVLPPLGYELGGISGINSILWLDGPRMLVLVLFTAPALKLLGDKSFKREPWVVGVDLAVVGYQLLLVGLAFPHATVTTVIRTVVESLLDVLLPYYVVSRAIRNEVDLRFLLTHLALGFALSASIGVAEFLLHHSLYSELQWVYGFKWSLTMQLERGAFLRVQAMTPTPIVLAFEMIFGLGLWYYLRGIDWSRASVKFVYALIAACLAVTFSRGPWIGAFVFGVALLGLKRLPVKSFVTLLLVLLAGAIAVKVVGADDMVMNALGAIFGSSEQDLDTIAYRRELLDTSLALIKQSPWLGVPDYASHMQNLRQGEGIIDLVNSYVAVALNSGLIGLAIYLLPFVLVLNRLLRLPELGSRDGTTKPVVRFAMAFVAMSIGMLLTIFTTSTFSTMPFLLMMLLALPIARLSMKAMPSGAAPEPASIVMRTATGLALTRQ